jgi:hypothetical protein
MGLDGAIGKQLLWASTKWPRPLFELRDGETVVATFRPGLAGFTLAKGRVGDRGWVLRGDFLMRTITFEWTDGPKDTVTFSHPRQTGPLVDERTIVGPHSRAYTLKPGPEPEGRVLVDEDGGALLEYHDTGATLSLKPEVRLTMMPGIRDTESPEAVLMISWYFLITGRRFASDGR